MRDETYIVDLCDAVLGQPALRQYRFPFLFGDPTKRGRRIPLPVDAYYEKLSLVVEYHERQHCEPSPFFDRRIVASGITRGEQRRIYDLRRMEILPQNGIEVIVIGYKEFELNSNKRLRRAPSDLEVVRLRLSPFFRLQGS
jgi:hypothetical protein